MHYWKINLKSAGVGVRDGRRAFPSLTLADFMGLYAYCCRGNVRVAHTNGVCVWSKFCTRIMQTRRKYAHAEDSEVARIQNAQSLNMQ